MADPTYPTLIPMPFSRRTTSIGAFYAEAEPEGSIARTVFPLDIAEGGSVTIGYATSVVVMQTGAEQRNVNWHDPRLSWSIGMGAMTKADLTRITTFFRRRGGALDTFLFYDWSDHTGTMEYLGVGDGVRTQFQLAKHYITDRVATRPIFRPVDGTVTITNGTTPYVEGTDYTLDYETGIVTFATAPPAMTEIYASFEFYVLARFAMDGMAASLDGIVADWTSIQIVEVREQTALPLSSPPASGTDTFPLKLKAQVGGPVYRTRVAETANGWEVRGSEWAEPRTRYDGQFDMMPPEWRDTLIAWYRSHYGAAYHFRFKDWSDYRIETPALCTATADPLIWAITKRYTDDIGEATRWITHPVISSLHVWDGGLEVTTGWVFDEASGMLVFDSPPARAPGVTCDFDVPVRFEVDELTIGMNEALMYSCDSVPLVEVAA